MGPSFLKHRFKSGWRYYKETGMLTRDQYDMIQDASQHFEETFEQMRDRLERQEAEKAAIKADCTHSVKTGVYLTKSRKPEVIAWIIDRTGKFVKFATNNATEENFGKNVLEGIRTATYNW